MRAALGARVRLRCAVLGAPPVLRRWAPVPRAHSVTDTGDLVIHSKLRSGLRRASNINFLAFEQSHLNILVP